MSSMRNAVTRRPHKERSQPESRAKWGLLEKHKDYSLRAKDYNLKKAKLAILSSKARERNPDEFAFGMMSASKTSQGKHGRQGEETNRLSHDAVKLLKSQDAGYLRAVAGQGRRELERLEQAVGLESVSLGSRRTQVAKKVVFVDVEEGGEQEKRGRKRKVEEIDQEQDGMDVMSTDADAQNVALGRPELHDEDQTRAAAPAKAKSKKALHAGHRAKLDLRAARQRRKRLGELRIAKLEALKKRQKEVMAAAGRLELQRAKMSRTVGGVNKDGVKWKIRERKK